MRLTGPELSIDEVNERYPLQWVLLKVTRQDDRGMITHGELLDHSRHRATINRKIAPLHAVDPNAHIYIFFGGTKFGASANLRDALRKFERDELDAWP